MLVWSLNYDVTNSGTISGATINKCGLPDTSNIAVLFKGDTTNYGTVPPDGVNALTNTGTISSPGTAIQINAGETTITNTGTISGGNYAIYSSAAKDTVNINGGTVSGKIDLGGGVNDALTVEGAATLGFTLDRDTASSAQVLNVANVTIKAGATIAPTIGGTKNIQNNDTFLIVDTSIAVAATAANINIQNDATHPMITFSVQPVTATQLSIIASRNNSYYGNSCGNSSLGAVLDSLANSDSGDMATVIGALDGAGAASAQELQPNTDNSVTQTSQATMEQFLSTVFAHLDAFKNVTSEALKGPDVWTSGYGSYIHQDPRGASNGYNATIWGTALGYDIQLLDHLRFGLSGGFAQDFVRTKDSSARSDIDSYQGTIYGSYALDAYYVDTALSFAYNTYDASRHVAVGAIDRVARGDYNGQQYSAYIGGGYKFKGKNIELTPQVSFQYAHLRLNGYTESGAGAANLNVGAQDYNVAQTGLGMKLGYPVNLKNRIGKLTPELKFKWLYDWVGDAQQATSTFTGGGGSFNTRGFTPAQSSYDFGAKLILETTNFVTVSLSYDLELKEDFYGHYGLAEFRYRF
jgi:outer membrane autotransporter protein